MVTVHRMYGAFWDSHLLFRAAVVVCFILSSTRGWAGGWELVLLAGWTAPTYEQRFQYRPEIGFPDLPGVDIRQEGAFQLEARGGIAFGGNVSYYLTDSVGIEGRVDTVDFNIDTVAPRFVASVNLPGPFPPLGAELDLGEGEVEVERLFSFSMNVKARTTGRTRLVTSAGLSYLPHLRLRAQQTVGLAVTGIQELDQLLVTTVAIQAEALPDEEDEGRWGFNIGAGFEVDLGDNLALTGGARFFRFRKQTLVWRRTSDPVSPLEEFLLEALERQISPIELEPTYFQATGGIVVRF